MRYWCEKWYFGDAYINGIGYGYGYAYACGSGYYTGEYTGSFPSMLVTGVTLDEVVLNAIL